MARSYKQYNALVRALKTHAPPAYPISVRRLPLADGHEGFCYKHGKKFHIQISKTVPENRAIDILLHEWAHAVAWNTMLDAAKTDDEWNKLAHDASWGVAYSKVYQIYEQIYLPSIA
jgi:hypothetical protein